MTVKPDLIPRCDRDKLGICPKPAEKPSARVPGLKNNALECPGSRNVLGISVERVVVDYEIIADGDIHLFFVVNKANAPRAIQPMKVVG